MSEIIKHPHGHEYPAPAPNPPPPEGAVTLYERLGGKPGVSRLVKWFYARVRFEPDLQPIFDAHIPLWKDHLERIVDFWVGMVGGPSTYAGGMGRHGRLGIGPEHFATWLRVWEDNARHLLQPREADEVIALAHSLAQELLRMLGQGPKAGLSGESS